VTRTPATGSWPSSSPASKAPTSWTPTAVRSCAGRIREKPGLWRYLRVTKSGLLRIDRAKIAAEAKTDGRTLLRTSDLTMDAADVAPRRLVRATTAPACPAASS
jgi:hypothetical protein